MMISMNCVAQRFVCVGLFLLVTAFSTVCRADDLAIETYEFEWKVAKSGECTLLVVKDQDKTVVRLRGRSIQQLTLTDDEATELGKVLATSAEVNKKLKGTKEASESSKVGDINVKFMTSKEGTFMVGIAKGRSVANTVIMQRDDAILFAPHLSKSKQMVELVNKKINP